MIGSMSGGAQFLALFQARTAKQQTTRQAANGGSATNQNSAAEAKRQRDLEALENLKRVNANMKSDRKAAAAQKVDRLKRELQSLRQFSGGDPKAIARQVARIARELSAAAKEYSAGGGGAPIAAGAPVTGSEATGAEAAAPDGGAEQAVTAEAMTSPAAEAGAAEQAAAGSAEQAAQQATAQAAQLEAKAEDRAETPEQKEAKGETLTTTERADKERQAFTEDLQKRIGAFQKDAGEKEADAKFAAEVRTLFNQIKAMMNQQRRRAAEQSKDDPEMDQLAKDVTEAGLDIDQALTGGIGAGLVTPMLPVNLVV